MALKITNSISIPLREIVFVAIRAQGAGGQNINKVSNAVQLRFDVRASTLPDEVKERLSSFSDTRITNENIIIIKAQRFRSLEKNREDALARLAELVQRAIYVQKRRKQTKPSRSSQQRRLASKSLHGRTKAGRGRVKLEE